MMRSSSKVQSSPSMCILNPVLPYLNRTLRGALYIAQAPSLAWKKGGRNIAF